MNCRVALILTRNDQERTQVLSWCYALNEEENIASRLVEDSVTMRRVRSVRMMSVKMKFLGTQTLEWE